MPATLSPERLSPAAAGRTLHPGPVTPTRLTIVLPALNEEDAIARTIERCLEARQAIIAQTPVTHVKVVVVSDGSTDRTAEIAQQYTDVQVIVFERNRGYGAAIKEGWRRVGGDLLAFLDADGTCDPLYFIDMCNLALSDGVDIVLGSRMGPDSKMPRIRRIGNTLFAGLLGLLSQKRVSDSASGMRVIRAEALPKLLPLPNGLDFTPSMSARALMDHELCVKEVPMKYEERIGRSKLNVITDGLRFAREILSAAVYVKPSRITLPIVLLFVLVALAMSVFPVRFYIEYRVLPEWLVYRFLAILLLGVSSCTLLCATVIAEHMIALSQLRYERFLRRNRSWWGRRALRIYWRLSLLSVVLAVVLVWPGAVSYVRTGHVAASTLHWSRVVVATFFLLTFLQMTATACILRIIPAMHDRQRFLIKGA